MSEVILDPVPQKRMGFCFMATDGGFMKRETFTIRRGVLLFLSFLVALSLGLTSLGLADPLDNWHWRNPLRTDNTLNGVAYGKGSFVAVGDAGTILTSPDGVTWTGKNSGTSENLNGVVFANNVFVAVGDKGTILTSADGKIWANNSGNFESLYGVSYGNGVFVAVGNSGTILTSNDGVAWTKTSGTPSISFYGVAYGNGAFVAVGQGNAVATSLDGTNWTERAAGEKDLFGIVYENGLFVAVGETGSPQGANRCRGSPKVT
jgi:hypothetical protein